MKSRLKERQAFAFKPSTLQILSSLKSEHQWLDLVTGEFSNYHNLIDEVHRLACKDRYEKTSIKEISERTGHKPSVVTRFLHKVYERIWEINEEQPQLFSGPGIQYELQFIDSYQTQYSYFTMWLEVPLNYGDRFEWHFIRSRQDGYSYYVDNIKHALNQGKLTTTVTLRAGTFNSYRKMLYDKACFFELLSIEEKFHLSEYEMDRLLIHRVENDRNGYPESLEYLVKTKFR